MVDLNRGALNAAVQAAVDTAAQANAAAQDTLLGSPRKLHPSPRRVASPGLLSAPASGSYLASSDTVLASAAVPPASAQLGSDAVTAAFGSCHISAIAASRAAATNDKPPAVLPQSVHPQPARSSAATASAAASVAAGRAALEAAAAAMASQEGSAGRSSTPATAMAAVTPLAAVATARPQWKPITTLIPGGPTTLDLFR